KFGIRNFNGASPLPIFVDFGNFSGSYGYAIIEDGLIVRNYPSVCLERLGYCHSHLLKNFIPVSRLVVSEAVPGIRCKWRRWCNVGHIKKNVNMNTLSTGRRSDTHMVFIGKFPFFVYKDRLMNFSVWNIVNIQNYYRIILNLIHLRTTIPILV